MKILFSLVALAIMPLAAKAQFYEKYLFQGMDPIDRSKLGWQIENSASARIDDMYDNRLQIPLQNPSHAAKMSERAIRQTIGLVNSGMSFRERRLQLLAWINEDAAPYESAMGAGPIYAKIAFSPSHNVSRISWSNVSLKGILCYRTAKAVPGGGISQETFRLSEEAEYKIYRNNLRIATIRGVYATAKDTTASLPPLTLGPISLTLSGSIPGNPQLNVAQGDPILYDFDPYQGYLGSPVRYRIEAWLKGCTNEPDGIPSAASAMYSSGDIWMDSDGDSVPDFVPAQVVSQKRAAKPDQPPSVPQQPTPGTTQLTLKISQNSLDATVFDTNQASWQVGAVPVGGVAPYTFRWSQTLGIGEVVSSDNAGNATLRLRPFQCETASEIFQAVVTDSTGAVATSTVNASVSSQPKKNYCP